MYVEETGSLLNKAALSDSINYLHIKARLLRKEMKEIWSKGNIENLEKYLKLNDTLLATNLVAAELENLKNKL